jgi:hypothetical protein
MSTRIQQSNISSGTNKQSFVQATNTGVVVDVILDETHPRIKNKKDFQTAFTEKDTSLVGNVVIRKYSDGTTPNEQLTTFACLNPSDTELPLIGEAVELVTVGSIQYYRRIPGFSLNTGNAIKKRADVIYNKKEKISVQTSIIESAQTGTPLGNTTNETSETSEFGKYFRFNQANKLKLYEGDKLIQTRFGQSIRFSAYNNSNNVYSPTIIIRNRQDAQTQSTLKEGDLTEENVNSDGSIIVLSSGEYQIPFTSTTSITPTKFSSYPNPLKGDDHLLINSGKIIISSKTGPMVLISKGDYGFISDGKFSIDGGLGADLDFGGDVNITTTRTNSNISLNTGTGRLFLNTNSSGKSPNTGNSSEPLVRGNTLKQILETMIDLINSQVYRTPSGPTAVGPENRAQFNSLKRRLSEMLSTLNYTE